MIKDNLQLFIAKANFWGKKHGPELLLAGAIIGAVGAVVTAVKSTTKLDETLEPFNNKIDNIKKDLNDDNKIMNNEVDEKGLKKDLTTTYIKTGLTVTKLYLPSIALLGASISCMCGSHHMMKGRNLALAAAYTTLENGYNSYRNRVKAKIGEEEEEKLYKDIYKDKVEVVDPKTGKTKTIETEIPHASTEEFYDVMYGCGNYCWEKDAVLNFDHLMGKQAWLNEKFRRQGFLWLSDVYDALGYDISMLGTEKAIASHCLGWIYDPTDPERDNYISFGLTKPGTNIPTPRVAKQIEQNIPDFWLSLNVDGNILSGPKKYADYSKGNI